MDFQNEYDHQKMNKHQRWIAKLPLLQRRRRKEPRRGLTTRVLKKSHPNHRGASGSESTLKTEATAASSSSVISTHGFHNISRNGESTPDECQPPPYCPNIVDCDGKDDGSSFSGVEVQEGSRTGAGRGLPALTSSRKGTTIKRSRRARLGMERTLDAGSSTTQNRSLQGALEELFEDFCIWCMNLRSTCAVYLPTLAFDSSCTTSLHPALVGCVLGCILLAFRDLTVLILCLLATSRVLRVVGMWARYFAERRVHRDAVKSMRGMVRRLLRESERAISGDYSRQVLAGYLLYNCTAPGESYVASCIRYRMSAINRSVIQEMEERQLKRLGYQKSERDLFQ
jgi:hypothetical protein